MDNNKMIIGVIVAVVAFLGAPFALRALRPVAAAPVDAARPAGTAAAPNPAFQNPASGAAQPQAQMQQQWQQQQQAPEGLNAQNIVGTQWEVRAPQGTVQFQFGAGGQGVVIHPIAGQVPASWVSSGNQVSVSASAFGQSMNITATMQGNTLVAPNCSIRRIR